MMLRLSAQTVRRSWPPYVGAFVALACGVALIATAITLVGAVELTALSSTATPQERAELDGLASLFGIMSAVALFMAVFVVASTFGFVVATRRRELGLVRLVGATPWQVRRMVLGESAVVAVLASGAGCALATATTPALLALLRARGVTGADLQLPSPWLAWSVAAACGTAVALTGAWRASRRAARVRPVEVLREVGVERRRPGAWQLVVAATCLVAVVVVVATAHDIEPLFALVMAVLLPEVVVVGLVCVGGLVFPALAGLLARPFASRDVAARLAGDHLRSSARMTAALAAPVLAISAIAGSMILALSFTVDWTTAMDRAQLRAPYVVETGGDPDVVPLLRRTAGLEVVDPRTTLTLRVGRDATREAVEVVDLPAITRARGLQALEGDLSALAGGAVAVTSTYATDLGVGLGDRLRLGTARWTLRPTVGAVVHDAPDLHADVLVPRAVLAGRLRSATTDLAFVVPGDVDLSPVLAGTGAQLHRAEAWIGQVDARNRSANALGLWVLLGPSGLYAGIAIVNAVLVGVTQRRAQLRTVQLLGATTSQLRRMALWESGLVAAAALLAGGATTALVGWLVRRAVTADVAGVALTMPWAALLAILATCVGLALLAALVGAHRSARLRARS